MILSPQEKHGSKLISSEIPPIHRGCGSHQFLVSIIVCYFLELSHSRSWYASVHSLHRLSDGSHAAPESPATCRDYDVAVGKCSTKLIIEVTGVMAPLLALVGLVKILG